MPTWGIVLIDIAVVLILLQLFACLCRSVAFKHRCEKNPLLKYFTAEDFNLTATPVSTLCGKTKLNGFIYTDKSASDSGKLVIFCHGMGPGHIAYTTEIARLCKSGHTVLAVDYVGCNFSEGKGIGGMCYGVKSVVAAVDYARGSGELKDKKTYLVGHSWGGYSALCASKLRKVDGVVAMGAPVSPSGTVRDGASEMLTRPLAYLLQPFWFFAEFLKFGKLGNMNAAKSAKTNGTPTLIIHGDSDSTVKRFNAVYYKAEGENITKLLESGKAHNPYNTVEAEKLLSELSAKLRKAKKMSGQEREYFANFNYSAATEEDENVMKAIVDFIG